MFFCVCIAEDNYIHNISSAGVLSNGGSSYVTVQRNLIEHCGLAGVMNGFYQETDLMDNVNNRRWFESIGARTVNNIISNTLGAGIGLYAAKDAVVAHNTIYAAAQTMQTPVLINGVQHWVDSSSTGSPITGCESLTVANNIMVKSKTARKGMHVQIRNVASWQDASSHWSERHTDYGQQRLLLAARDEQAGVPVGSRRHAGGRACRQAVCGQRHRLAAAWDGSRSCSKIRSWTRNTASVSAARLLALLTPRSCHHHGLRWCRSTDNGTTDAGATQAYTPLSQRKSYPPLSELLVNRTPYTGGGK